jgi:hypothetical protein
VGQPGGLSRVGGAAVTRSGGEARWDAVVGGDELARLPPRRARHQHRLAAGSGVGDRFRQQGALGSGDDGSKGRLASPARSGRGRRGRARVAAASPCLSPTWGVADSGEGAARPRERRGWTSTAAAIAGLRRRRTGGGGRRDGGQYRGRARCVVGKSPGKKDKVHSGKRKKIMWSLGAGTTHVHSILRGSNDARPGGSFASQPPAE